MATIMRVGARKYKMALNGFILLIMVGLATFSGTKVGNYIGNPFFYNFSIFLVDKFRAIVIQFSFHNGENNIKKY